MTPDERVDLAERICVIASATRIERGYSREHVILVPVSLPPVERAAVQRCVASRDARVVLTSAGSTSS